MPPPPTKDSSSRTIWAWSLYDFANSAFTTLVVTFIYSTYFARAIAPDPDTGTWLWSIGVTVSALVIAVLSPFAGAMADRGGLRMRYLIIATIVCIAGSVALFFPTEGQVVYALIIFVIANVAFEMANVFYNAFLPDLAPPDKIGRISGYGWALGYAGGLVALLIGYYVLVAPDVPPFGLDKAAGEDVRATNLLVAAWFALFSLPMFFLVRDKPVADRPNTGALLKAAVKELKTTINHIRRYRQILRLLIARLVYNDGLVTIFAFGGIYAVGTFDFTTTDIFMFGIALNIAAGIGAYAFGFFDDKMGGKMTIAVSLVGLFIAALIAVTAPTREWFWVSAILVGLLAGPNQSASRSLMGRFIPPAHENEFYGFYAFSGKFTAFLGPMLLGQFTRIFHSQRAGVAVVMAFFLIGGILIMRVDEKEGIEASGRPGALKPAT